MKKQLVTTLMLGMCFAFSACGKTPEPVADIASDSVVEAVEENLEDEIEDIEDEIEDKLEEEATESASNVLADFLNGDEIKAALESVNESLEASGLKCDFQAEGADVLVFAYTFLEQKDFSSVSKDELTKTFDESLAPILAEQGKAIASEIADYGIDIKGLRILINNNDGKEIYSKIFGIE